MKNFRLKLQLLLIAMVLPLFMSAQTTIIRVKADGDNSKDGSSWENAKKDVQVAINAVYSSGGEVWVAKGTYKPTETTSETGSGNLAFKIPKGVTVRGGFAGTETAANQRATKSDKNFGAANYDGDELKSGRYANETVLSGNFQSGETRFTWNSSKQQFNTSFPGNSYHVVWFAMNGFANNRANALTGAAKLEGCIVEGGHAYTNDVNANHPTIGYGGGIYMVANSTVLNCEVRKCDASHNGGGIYMDGGGQVRRTYVHHCQTLGLGTEYGFGGGICQDGAAGTEKEKPVVVAQSVVTNCVGRMGGGMALLADAITDNNHKYAVVANSTLVNNNTAQIEAGGVYTYKGGGLASMTIVNNKCIGSGITQNGSVTGRSGGVYSKDAAYIGNTVMWGNECEANKDMQYASSRSSLTDTKKSKFYHSALSNAELVDWSGADRLGVLSLESTNTSSGSKSANKGFPLFFNPTPVAGYFAAVDEEIVGATDPKKQWINWTVSSESYLTFAGINTADLDYERLTPAPTVTSYDMQANPFSSRPTIGALVTQTGDVEAATNVSYDGTTYDYAYFVDPQFIFAGDNTGNNGGSWDLPARFLGNILDIVESKASVYTGKKVAIFVKQGTVNNTRAGNTSRVRVTSLEIPSNVTIIGSFNSELTGTDVSKRNPILTPTIISAQLMNDYKYNVAHLITIANKENITIDGFKLTFANAYSTELTNSIQYGAAITLTSSTGVKFKNITVSNCYGDKGTVVYSNASTASFENCIFHNNTTATLANSGLVYGINSSKLSFDHSNVLRSVGHVSYLDGSTTNNWKNSMFYGNLNQAQDNTNNCATYAIAAFEGDGVNATNLTGERCMFDLVSRPLYDKHANSSAVIDLGAGIPDNSTYYLRNTYVNGKVTEATETNPNGLEYEYHSGWANGYPRMVNPTKNAGYSTDGDVTYYGRATSFEPHNDNPVINAASTNGSAHTSPLPSNVWGVDITTVATRDYGGLPDIGAVESKYVPVGTDNENANPDGQPEYGRAMYVRDYRDGSGNVDYNAGGTGMSWQEAINGNAYYYEDGTHGSDKTKTIHVEKDVDVTTYTQGTATTIPNNTTGVLMKSGSNYLRYNGSTLTITNNVNEATMFRVTTSGTGYRISAVYNGGTVAIGYSGTSLAIGTASTWYRISGNNSACNFANKTGTNNRRYISANGTLTSTSATWTFYNRNSSTRKETRIVDETVNGINGLQFAVNSRYQDYSDQGKLSNKGVYVAAGTYTNATAKDANSVEQPYAYMMQEGVDVYGGFPAIGNPGMDQRQPKEYITILQAQTQSPYVTMTFVKGSEHPHKIRVQSNQDSYNDMMSVTNWGSCASSTDANDKASIGRVLVQPTNFAVQTSWDGFTIRHGYLNTAYRKNISNLLGLTTDNIKVAGGAGALLQGNGMLVNCEIKENLILVTPNLISTTVLTSTGEDNTKKDSNGYYTNHTGGAGVFMTGDATHTATLENCNIGKNQLLTKAVYTSVGTSHDTSYDNIWMYGAGLFQNSGNVYNTLIHDNDAATIRGTVELTMNASVVKNQEMILGGGAFIADGNFYNNTIVANTATSFYHQHSAHCTFAGVHVKDKARIYNSIIADNVSNWGFKMSWTSANSDSPGQGVPVSAFADNSIAKTSREPSKVFVTYSYLDVHKQEKGTQSGQNVWVDLVSQNDAKNTNIYLDYKQYEAFTATRTDVIYPTSAVYDHTAGDNQYRLMAGSPCINTGTTDVKDNAGHSVAIPDFDAGYDDRIQDCKIDIGAYESDGMATLQPQADATKKQAVFYVSPDGYGRTDGSDPENAACAPKLQMIIDAAGRYKIEHPDYQVIVKVANSYSLTHPANPEDATDFTYYATRTTDQGSTDTRLWSIQIPRGVEVWGGYTDANADGSEWTNSKNGFQTRNITANPTYFNSSFYNKDMKINATTYHVVTFIERIYDADGKPYLVGDYNSSTHTLASKSSYDGSQHDESAFLHMSQVVSGNVMADKIDGKTVSNRAVLDGIFVTGGNADGTSLSGTTNLNANGYGGAAIVTDYAYVRNCIVMNNMATNGGGLALTNGALVSGSLIIENNANDMGGGLYVFENGATLSNGIKVNTTAPVNQPMDYNMAHVLTSTIVGNIADQDGGGVWYTVSQDANVRFNSVAIWQNESGGQTNVHGTVNPEQPTEDETISEVFYPFAYSVIQNMRASGTDNQSVEPLNNQGIRFVDKKNDVGTGNLDQFNMAEEKNEAGLANKLADFGFYGLTTYSMLCSTGMPVDKYNQLIAAIAISDVDILGVNRIDPNSSFVEVGARALAKVFPNKELMLRLFVARPEDVDTKTAGRFMRLSQKEYQGGVLTDAEKYYSQEGSSFAYPFNSLQDALDYIKYARNGKIIVGTGQYDAQNLPFEIVVGKGTYYPRKDLNGGTISVWSQTFAIPEGVTIIGGFDPMGGAPEGGLTTYYGRYYKKVASGFKTDKGSVYDNVVEIPNTIAPKSATEIGRGNKYGNETVTLPATAGGEAAKTITFQQWDIQDIADRRTMNDNNKNGIIEPWEFKNQTIISGNAVNGETDGVYHVMTAVADEDAVGRMPMVKQMNDDFVGSDVDEETGYQWKEEGQQIRLNGLIVTGGNALTYLSTALDAYGSYIFYQGAGLQVDGNRYKNGTSGAPVFHNSAAYGVGYRDIPVSITNCQFRNNIAGYGGAISTNGSLSIFGSSFEQNLAVANTEKPETDKTWTGIGGANITEVNYPGQGGAILATRQLSAFNTLFANNEARYDDKYYTAMAPTAKDELFSHKSFRVPAGGAGTLRAAGGAIMMGSAAEHHIVNCDFVRNKANMYPAVFTMNPTVEQKANAEGKYDTHEYSQIINTVAWGNEVNQISTDENYLRASKLMVNIGKKERTTNYIKTKSADDFYDPSFDADNVPTAADLENTNAESTDWQEAVWFCAYEDGVGFKPNNINDLRDKIVYSPAEYAPAMIKKANVVEGVETYQNCNQRLVANNTAGDGPNFGSPSIKAGFDGFTEGADWSPARESHLVDNANGWIKQTVDPTDLNVTFDNAKGVADTYQGAYPVTHYIDQFPEYEKWLALGNEKYMQTANINEERELTINGTSIGRPYKNLPRISADPRNGIQKAYIDIGVYEYMKQALLKPGSEVDILWVSTTSAAENDGKTWQKPLGSIQTAIEKLLSSRNGHKKEIRIMEGDYTPTAAQIVKVNGTDTEVSAFVIDTQKMNSDATAPSSFNTDKKNERYYVQSLTIKGGYNKENGAYDPEHKKTVIRQSTTSDKNTDYLIYVADPTVRYYYSENGYTDANKQGATVTNPEYPDAATVKTMPIQVDGVTLINDQVKTDGTKGSAIYYPDYDGTYAPQADATGAHITSVGGKVVYYPSQEEMDKIDPETSEHIGETVDYETEFALVTTDGAQTVSDVKLLITKTMVVGSGKSGDTSDNASAVYIGKRGGAALIYNTVFHSNYSMPLDAYNTINVNNTFGKNAGLVRLQDADGVTYDIKSQIHNTAMWRNNNDGAQFEMPNVSVVTTDGDTKGNVSGIGIANFSYNSFTGGNMLYTADADMARNNYNTGLSNTNGEILNGPNFVDPENATILSRSFDIKPSVRLLNKGNGYRTPGDPDVYTGTYADLVVNNKYDFSIVSTTDKDVIERPRIVSEGNPQRIDIGAYEFQGSLQRVLYVNPNSNDSGTGDDWTKAFGKNDLQNAVDLAAIYHINSATKDESYVFVKGNSPTSPNANTGETLTIRDGVTVYGSIPADYTNWHDIKKGGTGPDADEPKYNSIDEFIADMTSTREGVASNAANKTIVTGIKTSEYTDFNGGSNGETPALVDGFVVTDPNNPTAPVVDVTNTSENAAIVIRNVVVADNDLSSATDENVNVAQISNGLIYEVLMRDNKPKGNGAVLKVSNYKEDEVVKTKGYAVNVTVEGKTIGADGTMPVDGESANGEAGAQIFKSITNSINSGAGTNAAGANAPYKTITNKAVSGYFYNIADPNLNYQLTETSKYIDMCELDGDANGNPNFLPANLKPFVHYTTDRDILGNPRLLSNVTIDAKIDRGAFETWRVDKDFTCGTAGTNHGNPIAAHFYPHDGSVVYIMENKNLVIDPIDENEVNATAENPGFLLVKEGASFYGNGRPATCAYVAVERKVRKDGSIVAVPYAMQYNENVSKPLYDTNGYLDQLDNNVVGGAYEYNGLKRSDWKYIFQAENTKCWEAIANNASTVANNGVLFNAKDNAFGEEEKVTTLRFTGKGVSLTDYIYTETTAASKAVTLKKYDDAESTNNGADFTDELDMGWNCFGIPYLVSEYKPYETATTVEHGEVNNGKYMMNIPHTLWLYYDGRHTPDYDPNNIPVDEYGNPVENYDAEEGKLVNGDGGYYSVKSWSAEATDWHVASVKEKALWVGEGIFTQTATLKDTESLTFYRPVAPTSFSSSAKSANVRYFYDATGVVEIDKDPAFGEDGYAVESTEYYTVNGMKIDKPRHGVVIIRETLTNGKVRTIKRTFK